MGTKKKVKLYSNIIYIYKKMTTDENNQRQFLKGKTTHSSIKKKKASYFETIRLLFQWHTSCEYVLNWSDNTGSCL